MNKGFAAAAFAASTNDVNYLLFRSILGGTGSLTATRLRPAQAPAASELRARLVDQGLDRLRGADARDGVAGAPDVGPAAGTGGIDGELLAGASLG